MRTFCFQLYCITRMTASEKLSSRHNLGDRGPVVDDSVTELASKLVDAKLSGSDSKTVTTNMFDPNHEFDLAELELDHDIAQLAEQNRSRKVSPCIPTCFISIQSAINYLKSSLSKSKLLDPTDQDTEEYKKMIEDRLVEGHGEFMMEIGVEGMLKNDISMICRRFRSLMKWSLVWHFCSC